MATTIGWESRIGQRVRLRDLHVFFAVVRSGSMAKAATQLNIAQPSISKAIGDLEAALGVRLFDRSTKGVELTIYGDALVKCGSIVLDELQQGIRHIEFLADPTVGVLKIGCCDVLAAVVLPQVLERFAEQYPRVVLHTENVPSPAINAAGLRDRKYDLVLGRSSLPLAHDPGTADLNIDFLFDDPFVLVAGAHTRWAHRRKIDLVDLIGEPWIIPPPHTWSYKLLAETFQERALDVPKANIVTASEPLRCSLLERGSFITILPNSWLCLQAKR
jgi:DNA-binding transcriptional LysR family regulator